MKVRELVPKHTQAKPFHHEGLPFAIQWLALCRNVRFSQVNPKTVRERFYVVRHSGDSRLAEAFLAGLSGPYSPFTNPRGCALKKAQMNSEALSA